MSQQPFQNQAWNQHQQDESMQQQQQQQRQQQQRRYGFKPYQPMRRPLYRDVLTNSQHELQTGQQSQQYQSSLSHLQSPDSLPTYPISQLTNEQQTQVYIGRF